MRVPLTRTGEPICRADPAPRDPVDRHRRRADPALLDPADQVDRHRRPADPAPLDPDVPEAAGVGWSHYSHGRYPRIDLAYTTAVG
jgi:hypothetical protein